MCSWARTLSSSTSSQMPWLISQRVNRKHNNDDSDDDADDNGDDDGESEVLLVVFTFTLLLLTNEAFSFDRRRPVKLWSTVVESRPVTTLARRHSRDVS